MMSPKDNNTDDNKQIDDHLNNKLNQLTNHTTITLQQQQEKREENPTAAMRFNKNLIVKPISNNNNININKSNTIKASNDNDNNNKTCNLIVKMINDVSKSCETIDEATAAVEVAATISGLGQNKQINNFSDRETSVTHTLSLASEGGNNVFHSNNNNNSNNIMKNLDNTNESFNDLSKDKMTNLNEVYNRESLLSTTTTISTESSLSSFVAVNERGRANVYEETKEERNEGRRGSEVEGVRAESLVTVITTRPTVLQKHIFNEYTARHKNITNKPLNDSYQRTVERVALKTGSNYLSQCDQLELNSANFEIDKPKDLKDYQEESVKEFKSLAERKALLKQEFFKDFTKELSVPEKSSKKFDLNKRILKKQHNLKLKIPSRESVKTSKELELPKKENSLVALRKLDLEKKLLPGKPIKPLESCLKTQFPKVKELCKRFDLKDNKMILPQNQKLETKSSKLDNMMERNSPLSDEGCNIGLSPYSSDDDNDSIRTCRTAIERVTGNKNKDKVARSASSDSALGLEVDEPMEVSEQQLQQQQKRRMTLTVTDLPLRPALLPLAEPTLLPDSPLPLPTQTTENSSQQQQQIPSKVLLEERVVEIPEDPRSGVSSRRESSQSCFSDYPPGEMQGVRFVRTPSVVVSDYSDDITCGITLEEIEYFRAQRLRRRRSSLETSGTEKDALDNNSDISASSSCSNLYYCGSTISALDGAECLVNGVRHQLERKTSDCSTCSISGDEENNFSIPEQPEDCQDITDMLANQHLTNKRCKKVGISTAGNLLTVDTNLNNINL